MKYISAPVSLFISAFVFLSCIATSDVLAKETSAKKLSALLKPIEHDAMQYGEGSIKAYVFIDPKCPHSQDFISMINENSKMRGIYRYYIFFYELKRFNSHDLIGTIYASSMPLQKMLEVMVGKKEIEQVHELDPKIEQKIGEIEHVAEEIGVNKRPYLIIAKEWD